MNRLDFSLKSPRPAPRSTPSPRHRRTPPPRAPHPSPTPIAVAFPALERANDRALCGRTRRMDGARTTCGAGVSRSCTCSRTPTRSEIEAGIHHERERDARAGDPATAAAARRSRALWGRLGKTRRADASGRNWCASCRRARLVRVPVAAERERDRAAVPLPGPRGAVAGGLSRHTSVSDHAVVDEQAARANGASRDEPLGRRFEVPRTPSRFATTSHRRNQRLPQRSRPRTRSTPWISCTRWRRTPIAVAPVLRFTSDTVRWPCRRGPCSSPATGEIARRTVGRLGRRLAEGPEATGYISRLEKRPWKRPPTWTSVGRPRWRRR